MGCRRIKVEWGFESWCSITTKGVIPFRASMIVIWVSMSDLVSELIGQMRPIEPMRLVSTAYHRWDGIERMQSTIGLVF